MRYLISSDYHLGHSKIIQYSNRPFKSAEEMNEIIIKNHNQRVTPDDIFIHNGDFCFKHNLTLDVEAGGRPIKAEQWLRRLNGHKIMMKGNHDASGGLKTCLESLNLSFAGRKFHITHKPTFSDPNADINLIGHVHNAWKIRTFKEHYSIIRGLFESGNIQPTDRLDLQDFMNTEYLNHDSESILYNVGCDVNRFMPVTLDEILGQIQKYKKTGSC